MRRAEKQNISKLLRCESKTTKSEISVSMDEGTPLAFFVACRSGGVEGRPRRERGLVPKPYLIIFIANICFIHLGLDCGLPESRRPAGMPRTASARRGVGCVRLNAPFGRLLAFRSSINSYGRQTTTHHLNETKKSHAAYSYTRESPSPLGPRAQRFKIIMERPRPAAMPRPA